VVDGAVEGSVEKTKGALALLAALGAAADAEMCADSKKLRAGKGKMRNRRYTHRKGPLVVYCEKDAALARAVRNLPGVDTAHVERLNLLTLAPGGHLGRFVVWTSGAFATLDKLYGSEPGLASELKKDYVTPRCIMENADLARIINSDEIQSIVNPAKSDTQRPKSAKKNPLKNLEAMLALNPYHAVHRASEMRKTAANKAARDKVVAAKRAGSYKVPADVTKLRKEKAARKPASTAFYNEASKDGEIA
jgi:large subunit ribosomal protein L4e